MPRTRDSFTTEGALKKLEQEMHTGLGRWLQAGNLIDLWRTCASCRHMSERGPAHCTKFNMTPPVMVIVGMRDCEAYDDNESIPF